MNDSQRTALAAYCQKYPQLAPVAYHEAGHAVVGRLKGRVIVAASIDAISDSAGRVEYAPRVGRANSYRTTLDSMVVFAAGPAAQLKFSPAGDDPTRNWSDGGDMAKLLECTSAILGLKAFSIDKANRLIDRAFVEAAKLVGKHWEAVQLVALRLFEFHETLLQVRTVK